MRYAAGLLALAVLTACGGPVSPERAAIQCEERARNATSPTGNVGVGINSSGKVGAGISIGITSDLLYGRDPYEVYEKCVRDKTGEAPIRPLLLEP